MVLDRLRRKKDDKELKSALKYGAVMGEIQRSLPDQDVLERLGIDPHILEDEKINGILDSLAYYKNKGGEVEADFAYLSLRLMITKLIRSSWLDPIDAMIGQLEAERLVTRIEMNMDEDEYEYGGTNLLEAISKIIQTAYSDAKDGRKVRLVKTMPRRIEIGTQELKEKKGGMLP